MSTLTIMADHFSNELSSERAKALFKASVSQIEIETFTYCNRACWFCPNSRIDRRSECLEETPQTVENFAKIARQLGLKQELISSVQSQASLTV